MQEQVYVFTHFFFLRLFDVSMGFFASEPFLGWWLFNRLLIVCLKVFAGLEQLIVIDSVTAFVDRFEVAGAVGVAVVRGIIIQLSLVDLECIKDFQFISVSVNWRLVDHVQARSGILVLRVNDW